MAEILFARPGQTLDAATLAASANDSRSLDERIAAIERLNPKLNGKSVTLGQFTPIFIPGANDNIALCGADFGSVRAGYTALPLDAKMSIDDVGADESLSLLQAFQQFKIDHLPQYQASDLATDSGSFSGGIIGAQAARSAGVIAQMKHIEALLKEYQIATGAQRRTLKASIRSAYQSLNTNFGTVLNKYIARTGRLGPLLSSRQGMKAALKGRTSITNSAKARPLINAANGFRYVSRGFIALDVGFRARNVWRSNNMGRAFMTEAMGFGFSTGAGLLLGKIGVMLALGPLGWVIALVVIGIAVVSMDYLGKMLGNSVYDRGASFYNNSLMPLTY